MSCIQVLPYVYCRFAEALLLLAQVYSGSLAEAVDLIEGSQYSLVRPTAVYTPEPGQFDTPSETILDDLLNRSQSPVSVPLASAPKDAAVSLQPLDELTSVQQVSPHSPAKKPKRCSKGSDAHAATAQQQAKSESAKSSKHGDSGKPGLTTRLFSPSNWQWSYTDALSTANAHAPNAAALGPHAATNYAAANASSANAVAASAAAPKARQLRQTKGLESRDQIKAVRHVQVTSFRHVCCITGRHVFIIIYNFSQSQPLRSTWAVGLAVLVLSASTI